MDDHKCWACESPWIHYLDVLGMVWCEPCWNASNEYAATQHEDPA